MTDDYRWLTNLSQTFLKNDYLVNGQTVDQRVDEICNAAEKILNKPGFAARFKENFKKGWYSLSTPIWANFGTDRGMPISCFGSYMADTTESIAYTHAEVMMMTKHGGGTSAHFGELRSRGSEIKNNGQSDGAVHFMRMFDSLISVISQGSTRRGNFAAYLPIDHKDITEFLTLRSEGSPIQDLSFGVTVPDYWIKEMIAGDKDKRKTWARVLECRANTGYPYIIFIDNANNNTVDVYKDKSMKINNSNLCVTGDQRVVSDRGLKTAKQLFEEGGNIKLFDNNQVVNASPMQLIEKNAKVYRVNLSNGMSHTVTSYHKLKVKAGNSTQDIACCDLKVGDKVAIQTAKGIFGNKECQDEAFIVGACQANYSKNSYLNEQVQDAYNRVIDSQICTKPTQRQIQQEFVFDKNVVPDWIFEADEESQWSYIKGFFSSNEKITDRAFLEQVQLIFANLGIQTSIKFIRSKNSYYKLVISNTNDGLIFNQNLELFDLKNISVQNQIEKNQFSSVASIEYVGEEDVYCCTVDSDAHHWICNGVVTHNCTEIFLPTNEEESFVCDLSSMNILYYDEWKDTDAVELLVYLLDAVMTEFIEKASKVKFMERAVRFATRHRAIGVGWLGWHSYLQSKMIAFESAEAKRHNVKIAKNIKEKAYAASTKMAQEYGEPEVLTGYGRRHTTLMAVAPTKSSSFILGQVSEGIEPHRSNYYIKDLAKGKFTIKNNHLEQLLESKGQNLPEVWESILRNAGSVQHLDCLTGDEKLVFKTFAEISQKECIIQAAQRQKYIDQGQSLNLMIHPSIPIKDVNALILEAWELGIKSLYYQISVNAAQSFSRDILACASCQS